ncbi:MAG: pyruvate kinase [Nitriliruptoraceae bacterium]
MGAYDGTTSPHTLTDRRIAVRRAKIVATLGPALDDPDRLRAAIAAGIDVVRLNFSHGTAEEHARRLASVHEIAADLGKVVGSLGDLQGPKIRLGVVPGSGVTLVDGSEVRLVGDSEGSEPAASATLAQEPDAAASAEAPEAPEAPKADASADTPVLTVVYEHLARDVEPGAMVLIDDGLIRLTVTGVDGDVVTARVVVGGLVTSRKGVNLPGMKVSAESMTDKDRADVRTMIELGVDWIALSFVRRPDDVHGLRALIRSLGGVQPIVAKLERPEALDNLEAIIEATDAVMVARGDLGVEIGPERVPAIQKQIIDLANRESCPVITATEMLESMVRSSRPTRAEASDVANAIFDGTDAVMLSGETAAGRYPVESVATMARIVEVAESAAQRVRPVAPETGQVLGRVVAKAAKQIADDVDALAILVFSLSGASVQLVSKFRPQQPIIGLTTDDRSLRRFALMWGTAGRMVPERDHSQDLILAAEDVCLEHGYADKGDTLVIVSGIPGGIGGTNRVLVHRIGDLAGQ